MRIICLSDIHSRFGNWNVDKMPDGDVALVAGDITDGGSLLEMTLAQEWLDRLAQRYETFYIPGNHDIGFPDGLPTNAMCPLFAKYYVTDSFLSVTSEHLTIQGVNCSPCYNYPKLAEIFIGMTVDKEEEENAYSLDYVDIVLSHCPPKGVLDLERGLKHGDPDENIGSQCLMDYITTHQPGLVVCGHAHAGGGKYEYIDNTQAQGSTLVVNTACHLTVVDVFHGLYTVESIIRGC